MKKLIYQIDGYTSVYNPETETLEQHSSLASVEVFCENQAQFDECYAKAEKMAVGEIIVEGEFEPETDNATTDEVLNTLLGV